MCDTLLAPPLTNADHIMLFGKNSDRQRNEAQLVEFLPRADYEPSAHLKCTYLTIPQGRRTHAVLMSRPFWTWGAEMGANEHGVVIGNEGLHARCPAPEEEALTGMDLLRLALERAATAVQAVEIITRLLEQYGQGGNCGHLSPAYYNNGFMIADPEDAFVLETVGREWLLESVRGVRALSNRYSIENPDQLSAGLPKVIADVGSSSDPIHRFAEVLANPHREHIGYASARRARATSLLRALEGRLVPADVMRILRDHGSPSLAPPDWHPRRASDVTLCMHAGAPERPGQTVSSWVSELRHEYAVHWVTGSAAPCISLFKPLIADAPVPPHGPSPTDRFEPRAFWWRHERMHRAALMGDFAGFVNGIQQERDALEKAFQEQIRGVLDGGDREDRSHTIGSCWKVALATEERWAAAIRQTFQNEQGPYYAGWTQMNQIAGVPILANSG